MKKKRKKKKDLEKTIDMTDLLINSKDKLGRHNEFVRTGCGAWKNKKAYTRKTKHKNKNLNI